MMPVSPIRDPNQWVLWEVDHIDGNASNNDISNLRWVLGVTNKTITMAKNRRAKRRRSENNIVR